MTEPHFPESKKTTDSSNEKNNEKITYIIISIDIVPVEGVDTIFIKLQNVETNLYLIRMPKEIILNEKITRGLSIKELIRISYFAGYEHNARGSCTLDGDDDQKED